MLFFRVFSSERRPARSILLTSRVFNAVARLINGKKTKTKNKKTPVLHRPAYEERSFYVTVSRHPNSIKVPKARSRTNRHAFAVAREMKHEFLFNLGPNTLHNACTVLKYLSSCYFKSLIAFATGKSRNKWYLSQAWVEKET